MTITLKDAVRAIRTHTPDVTIEALQEIKMGQNSFVLIVNHKLVYRFPRYERVRADLKREAQLLNILHAHISALNIPTITFNNLGCPLGEAFLSHARVSGDACNIYKLHKQVKPEVLASNAEQLATFLHELHGIPLPTVEAILPDMTHAHWHEMYHDIQAYLFPLMRPALRDEVRSNFEEFLAIDEESLPRAVIHGDFGTGNILYNPDKQRFCSVIDFGSTCIGDPAVDLAAIYGYRGRGADFAQLVMAHDAAWQAMLPRIKFYASTFALQEALFGVENNDHEAFKAGMKDYR